MREHRCIRMNRRAKRKSAISNLKRRLPERQTHTSIAINKILGQTPCMKQREKEAVKMEQQTPDRKTHTYFPHRKCFTMSKTTDMKRRKDGEFAVSNIERQKPDRQINTIFPNRMRNMQVKETTAARGAELPSTNKKRSKGRDIVVANIERQKPDRQALTIFPNRQRSASGKVT